MNPYKQPFRRTSCATFPYTGKATVAAVVAINAGCGVLFRLSQQKELAALLTEGLL